MSGYNWGGEPTSPSTVAARPVLSHAGLSALLADSRRDWVKGVLDDALVIVAELGVPADLAPVALAKAIDLLAAVAG